MHLAHTPIRQPQHPSPSLGLHHLSIPFPTTTNTHALPDAEGAARRRSLHKKTYQVYTIVMKNSSFISFILVLIAGAQCAGGTGQESSSERVGVSHSLHKIASGSITISNKANHLHSKQRHTQRGKKRKGSDSCVGQPPVYCSSDLCKTCLYVDGYPEDCYCCCDDPYCFGNISATCQAWGGSSRKGNRNNK